MKKLIPFLLSVLILLSPGFSNAGQVSDPYFEHLTIKNGLANNFVTAITQDSNGFLWVGTDAGLSRFDGRNFFTLTSRNSPLQSNSITALLYDSVENVVWVGNKSGVAKYDCSTRTLSVPELPENISRYKGAPVLYNVADIARASDGGIWIVNHFDNLVHYSPESGEYKVYNAGNTPGLASSFDCVAEDGKGNLYMGHKNEGFSVMNLRTLKITNFRHEPGNPESLPYNKVDCMEIDREGRVWIGTHKGLALFNPSTERFIGFHHVQGDSGSLLGDRVCDITQMDDGSLWVGTELGGISILNPASMLVGEGRNPEFLNIAPFAGPSSLSSDNVRKIYEDSFGNVWIGNYSAGIDFLAKTPPMFNEADYFRNPLNHGKNKIVWSVAPAGSGMTWVGLQNELALFDKGEKVRSYDITPYLTHNQVRINSMLVDGEHLYLGLSDNGILRMHVVSGHIERVDAQMSDLACRTLCRRPDGAILIGASDGIYVLEEGRIRKDDRLSGDIWSSTPPGLMYDRQGKLWAGTDGSGVFIFDPSGKMVCHLSVEEGLASNSVTQLCLDSRGMMWIAGKEGFTCVADTRDPRKLKAYGYAEGLKDLYIRSVIEDKNGDIWFSTNSGLMCLGLPDGEISFFDNLNGLPQTTFMERSSAMMADGRLCFGMVDGLCWFNPRMLTQHTSVADVKIVDIFSRSNDAERTPENIAIPSDGSPISLPYDKSTFTISFSVPDFAHNKLVEYSYRMVGLDDTWTPMNGEDRVTFRNLEAGSYEFQVRARLRGQSWEEAKTAVLAIRVSPPWWFSWWMKLLYAVVVMAGVYTWFHIYRKRLIRDSDREMERQKSISDRELNEERLRFYTNVTHELRTPVTLILGPLEDLVNDASFPAPYKKKVGIIHNSAQRLLGLINQILDFRKAETQNTRLKVASADLGALVTEIGLRYQELNRNPKVRVKIEVDKRVTPFCFDSDIMATVINNLMGNALKYTSEGVICLSLAKVEEDGRNLAEVKVSDTGFGISAEDLPHIFDRYYQGNGRNQASGTGIGLALVKSLSTVHQASLEVESEQGKGTVFTWRLDMDNTYPDALRKEAKAETAAPGFPVSEESGEKGGDRRPMVLVVEDNDDIRDYIAASLLPHFQVLTAVDGKEGFSMACEYMPDIIISDIMMPVTDGIEMCRMVKAEISTSHIPVVMLTAKDSIEDKETGYLSGADSYLTKPFSARLLITRLQNILDSRKALARLLARKSAPEAIGKEDREDRGGRLHTEVKPLKLSKLDEAFLKKLTTLVEENINRPDLDMAFVQNALNMSHSTLYRKIKGLLGVSGNEFIRKIKLRKGYELMGEGCNVSEAAFSCGFNDVGYFRSCFKEEYGMSPSQFIRSRGKVRDNAAKTETVGV